MSFLTDLFLELVAPDVAPASERGLIARSTTGSVILLATTVWLLATYPDSIEQPSWALPVLAGSVLCGSVGLLLSLLHAARNASDRLFGVLCFFINAAAVITPFVG